MTRESLTIYELIRTPMASQMKSSGRISLAVVAVAIIAFGAAFLVVAFNRRFKTRASEEFEKRRLTGPWGYSAPTFIGGGIVMVLLGLGMILFSIIG